MTIRKTWLPWYFSLCAYQFLCAIPLAEQLKHIGYAEICNAQQESAAFDSLYAYFDELVTFLQVHPVWVQKLYSAKERFIRSQDRNFYSTDFFGFYDESNRVDRSQVAFYYSIHFHTFICSRYPEFKQVPEIMHFFDACLEMQKPCEHIFNETATELGLEAIFSSRYAHPPILLKVIKYLPSYSDIATKPHYDGTAFSLFLNSTDNQSLLMSAYKPLFSIDDFSSPIRKCSSSHNQNSFLLIPGTLLTEFSLYPTPHLVIPSGKTRYATIAFAMRPHYMPHIQELSPLPIFKH